MNLLRINGNHEVLRKLWVCRKRIKEEKRVESCSGKQKTEKGSHAQKEAEIVEKFETE